MRGNPNDQINSLRNQFDRWYYTSFPNSPKQKRTYLIIILLVCILFLILLPLITDVTATKRLFIWIIIAAACVNIVYLLYENYMDTSAPPARYVQPDYPYRTPGQFQPRVESTTKRLLRETNEQLESGSKTVRKSYPYEHSLNQTDPNITRRRIEPEIRHYETPNQTQILGDQSYQQPSNANRSYTNAFEEFANAPKNLSRSGGTKTLRDIAPPGSFEYSRGSPNRPNFHMQMGSRRGDGYSGYNSNSPFRGTTNMRGQPGKNMNQMPGKLLGDEQEFPLRADQSYIKSVEEEANNCLKNLKITMEFPEWKKNCQRWFFARLIPKILDDNISNIKELNRTITYFDKNLYEFEYIMKLEQQQSRSDSIPQQRSTVPLITIDELLNYEESVHKGGPLWPSSQLSLTDIARAHQDISFLVRIRRQLERYFEISGFRTFEVRAYVLERLMKLKGNLSNFTYSVDGVRKKYPTDTQILSNLFFTFLNAETINQTEDKQPIYRNLVFKTNSNIIPKNISNEDVYFRESTTESFEPHYDILSGKEVWKTPPGVDNLFCAVVLFVHHIRTKRHGTLGLEESKAFRDFTDCVIP